MNESNRLQASFGRRRGRKLRPGAQAAMDEVLPTLKLPDLLQDNPEWKVFQSSHKEWWFEIGFGGGEHLAHIASHNPNIGMIGCEPFINGIAHLVGDLEKQESKNVRLYTDDVRELLPKLAGLADSQKIQLSRVYILFPDPWHKVRHRKRRLINSFFIQQLKPLLQNGAIIRCATDHTDYARQMLEVFLSDNHFTWTANRQQDWNTRFEGSIKTRYEEKQLGDMKPQFFEFVYR